MATLDLGRTVDLAGDLGACLEGPGARWALARSLPAAFGRLAPLLGFNRANATGAYSLDLRAPGDRQVADNLQRA